MVSPVRDRAYTLLLYALALVLLALFCGPILWMLSGSLKTPDELFLHPYAPLPSTPSLATYTDALHGGALDNVQLPRQFINSSIYALVSVVTNLALALPAGYAFARLRFPFRRALFALVVVAMMVPTAAIIIPLFTVVRAVSFGAGPAGWLDTYQGLILPTSVTGLSIVLARQFLRAVPRELDDAALVDGCSPYGILLRVLLPLSGPAAATIATLTFLARWNDYLWPAVAASISPDMFTLQVGLRFLETSHAQEWSLLLASCTLAAVPIVLMYVALQPLFDRGLASLGTGWES